MAIGNLLGGFAKGYFQAKQAKESREEREQERKARMKLIEIQLKQAQRQQEIFEQQQQARQELLGKFNPVVIDESGAAGATPEGGPYGGVGPTRLPRQPQKPPSLTELLADPENAMLLLRSGMGNLGDITKIQGQSQNQALLQSLMGGAGGGGGGAPSGMELSGLKLDPSGRPMLDFARREIWQEVPSPDGKSLVQIDRQGRVMGSRPASPEELPQPTEEDKRKRDLAAAMDVYETARQGLLSGLEGTVTGPLLGKLPAITTGQQKAQGSVAAMAPVLKQLFRAAGEGIFTDRDQQLLLEMIPTRETTPEARKAMIENIDAIVRAKLQLGQQGAQGALPAGIPSGSVQIGTSGGKPVYQTPDGKRLIVE